LFFNERMDAAGALHVSQNGEVVPGTAQTSGNGQVVTFQPTGPWVPNALIQVFLDGSARDSSGNGVYPYQGSFRTAEDPFTAIPIVTATSPAYGSGNVPLNVVHPR
jgi:hypothetical protein